MWQIAYLISLVSSQFCPTYTCSNSSSTTGTCIDYSITEGVDHYTLTPCDVTLQCSFDTQSSSSCKNYQKNTRYPGDYCYSNDDCISASCVSNVCVSILIIGCNRTADCLPETYCSDQMCTPHRSTGDGCLTDIECKNSDLCDNNICTTMFSLDNESPTSVLWKTFAPLCKTGYAIIIEDEDLNELYICAEAPKSISSALTPCEVGNITCTASDGETFKPCKCGFDGKQYCPLFEGDEDVVKMIEEWPELFEASEANCNGENKWGYDCFSRLDFNQSLYLDWAIRYNKYFKGTWYTLPTAPLCAKSTILKPYYNIELDKSSPPACQQFYQASDTTNWNLNQCSYAVSNIYDNAYSSAVFTTSCQANQICTFSDISKNGTCVSPTPSIAKPGEYCKKDSDCYPEKCSGSRCTGLKVGAGCSAEIGLNCQPGTFCNSNKVCENVNENLKCVSDASCNSTSVCFQGNCVKMFSLQNGGQGQIEDFSDHGYSRTCNSGFAYNDSASGLVVCAPAPRTNGTYMASCILGDSVSDTTGNYTLSCMCGLSGGSYFPAFIGDGNYLTNAMMYFKDFAGRTSCFDNVWTLACLKYDSKLLYKYYKYYINIQMLSYGYRYKNAANLVLQNYANDYFVAVTYTNTTVESSSFSKILIGIGLVYLV